MLPPARPSHDSSSRTPEPHAVSRRQFLQRATAATAAFQIVRSDVLGLSGTAPSEKLNIAGIGVAGQGGADLNQFKDHNIVALCDVDWAHAAGTFNKFPNAKRFKDFRKMLDEVKEIDAVVVATPDHMHAFASMAALQLGKHVYCEKPLTHSVWEARRVTEFARQQKVATQMGNQGQASEDTRRLCELIWNGAIGAVREVHVWTDRPSQGLFKEYWPQGVERPADSPNIPETLDWDLWLGPAPERPFNPAYLPTKWRGWWDFGTGALGDIGCHSFDPIFRALKLGAPTSVQASSTRVNVETYPLASMVTYHFPARSADVQANNVQIRGLQGVAAGGIEMPPVKLTWYDGDMRPPRPEGLDEGVEMGTNGRLLVGDKGFILGTTVYPESRRKELPEIAKSIPRSGGHYVEWAEACKGGNTAGSNFEWAGPLAETVLLGNVALRLQLREELTTRALLWDAAALRFTNSDTANQFLKREYRKGWTL
ncbi:Gfo/Idh/MocA family oxidoreductase [Verrucomicrobiota bacterium sgz303538]